MFADLNSQKYWQAIVADTEEELMEILRQIRLPISKPQFQYRPDGKVVAFVTSPMGQLKIQDKRKRSKKVV